MTDNQRPTVSVQIAAEDERTTVVRIAGEVDLSTLPEVEERLAPVLAQPPERLVIDLAELRFADSSAIALWVRCAMAVERFELRDPPQFLALVIRSMGLAGRLGLV